MTDPERNLSDKDVEAIVGELKRQLLADFRMEVGSGVLVWVKRAAILFLLYLAVLGIQGDKSVFSSFQQVHQ